ncbi:glycosyltransferase [Clostridium neonatale]|uniref:glycosyltransferase n=1 Tax=Clostridium neonatale TaxID=137838 RepID=UPI00291BBB6D|nr:glycosyltransferase [Clostridium neonatale]CAI3632150.1 rhamnosyltransferase [Clostridium neonatale]
MSKCMQIDKPLVSILLAVYKPNEKWLIELLISLNEQTYENLELLIYDDCPDSPVNEDYFKKHITNFKYTLIRGETNKGSNKAFEELTKLGNGEFFAYCDQDDIWENNKIEILTTLIKKERSIIAYSDMKVIDEDGKIVANTLLDVKTRLNYIKGEKILSKIFFKNCISGCCMLIESKVAKKAIPFSKYVLHDQWLSIIASCYGKICFTNKSLVKYRIHGDNQTYSLKGINDKKDYYKLRVEVLKDRLIELENFISKNDVDLDEIKEFCCARINKNIFKIIKYRYLCKKEAYFEVAIKYMPNFIFKIIIKVK